MTDDPTMAQMFGMTIMALIDFTLVIYFAVTWSCN